MSENFTREDAVAAIIAMDNPSTEPAEAEVTVTEELPTSEAEEEISSEETPTQTDDTSEDNAPGDGEEGESQEEEQQVEAEAETVDAPQWWDAESKGKFAELSPELQAIVKAQEDKREVVTQKAKQEAAEARKAAEVETRKTADLATRANAILDKAEVAFRSKWDGMTPEVWAELASSDSEMAFQLKIEYDAEQEQLRSVRATQEQTSHVAQQQHYAEQRAKLQEIAPELVSSPEKLNALGVYIAKSGIPVEAIPQATADELNIVYKAMKYDEMMSKAQAVRKAAPTAPKPAPQKSLAPAAARETSLPPQEREVRTIKNRLAQTGSRDDLAALFKTGAFG